MQYKLINEINPNFTIVEQLFTNRGVPIEKVERLLNTTDKDIINYINLDNILKAVEMVINHINRGSKILIEVDCDVDGYTSGALFYNFVKINYPSANLFYNVHDYKRHGLDMSEAVLNKEYDLIVIPDAGSGEFEKHKTLHDLEIDCLILDHHEADKESEHALVVNNQLSKNYDNKELSGVGVVWQFCRAMEDNMPKVTAKADCFLDLVALGLVADMMDLRSLETRRLIDKGLDIMNAKGLPYSNDLINDMVERQSYSLGSEVTPIGIAFYIAPMINATVRVGEHTERISIFESFLFDKSNELLPSTKRGAKEGETEIASEQSVRIMGNIRNRQKREETKGVEAFGGHIDEDYLEENSLIVLDTGGAVVKDLNGLIANQMQSEYRRPALVLRETENGLIEGSGRGHPTSEMEDFRGFIRDSGLAEYAEGHPNAFGTGFTKENFEKFIEYANNKLDYDNAHKEYMVDFVIDYEDIDSDMILEIAKLKKYWGQEMDEPYIYFKNVVIGTNDKMLMRNNTLKLMAKDVPCIKFRAEDGVFEKIAPNQYTNTIVDIIGRPNLNEYQGNINGQIFISDYKIVRNKVTF